MRRSFAPALLAPIVFALGCGDQNLVEPDATQAPVAATQPDFSVHTSTVTRTSLSFVLDPETCSALTTTITGVGREVLTIQQRRNHNGTTSIRIRDEVTGIAAGADGSSYRFHYVQAGFQTAPEPPFDGNFTDRFRLNGQRGAPDVFVKQIFRFRITAKGDFVDLGSEVVSGDPACDPI